MLLDISHTTYSLLVFQGKILVLDFHEFVLSCLCILHNLYILLQSFL